MDIKELQGKLVEYLTEASPMFEADKLKDDDDLTDAGLDSLDMVNFLLSVEEGLGVKIADDELTDLTTINHFIKRINDELTK